MQWLDFLHPGNEYLPLTYPSDPETLDYFNETLPLYAAIFTGKIAARMKDLILQTPRIFRYVVEVWLRAPEYLAVGTWFFYHDRFFLDLDYIMDAMHGLLYMQSERSDIATIGPVLKAQVMAAVKSRVVDLYKCAINLLQVCFDLEDADDWVDRIIELHILLLTTFVDEIPLAHYPRDLMRSIVQQALRTRTEKQKCNICNFVGFIWHLDKNSRSMAWAIRDSILPLIIANGKTAAGELTYAMNKVAFRSVYLPVVRALGANGGPPAFAGPAWGNNEAYSVNLDKELQRRVKIARSLHYGVCSYPDCGSASGEKAVKTRRCVCFDAFYCSRECQRAHRKVHKKICVDRAHRQLDPGLPFKNPLEAFFVSKLTLDHIERSRDEILARIKKSMEDNPQALTCIVEVNLATLPAPTYKVRALSSYAPELVQRMMRPDEVLVKARLRAMDPVITELVVCVLRLALSDLSVRAY
ncbi:uncharacterized protein SCHCODRAFT_02505212 [Schizophyllum commune H4-8]|uniref:MYND-type domain-containing protein n=1 Tax=Schizophyllum commune (strain H4-8 / FGSC 9210) TaxID=578458 RepID=D8Q6C4_SCHCM|nr:uncharacterized protein SCHCODRAFT_02505212 [Schizophyllum commune H4-8]KAI5891008.1 hypothetical protein SCHCODRAFT_02505212 [Schizophyllum commune H4-8]